VLAEEAFVLVIVVVEEPNVPSAVRKGRGCVDILAVVTRISSTFLDHKHDSRGYLCDDCFARLTDLIIEMWVRDEAQNGFLICFPRRTLT